MLAFLCYSFFFFIKQKTAYEMRISDWSSDVCSSDLNDAPNTNVVGLAGRTFAIVEAGGKPVELGYELNTIAHHPFDGTLIGGYTAHPHHDPCTDEMHAITCRGDEPNKVWHVVLDGQAHVIREEAVAVSDGPSIHDCAITENYVLVFDLPVTFSLKMLIAG